MSLPSLLFRAEPTGVKLDPGVFADLQLTKILSSGTLETISMLCSPDDLPFRQDVYRTIAPRLPFFGELTAAAQHLNSAYGAYSTARSETERDYLYVRLILTAINFADLAAVTPGDSELIAEFRGALSDMFSAERRSADVLSTAANSVLNLGFLVKGDNLKVYRRGGDKSIIERLKVAADALGLGLRLDSRKLNEQLNTRVINAVSALFPEEFKAFSEFRAEFQSEFNTDLLKYCNELTLYTEVATLYANSEIEHSFPSFVADKSLEATDLRDLSLLFKERRGIVANDVFFTPSEPFFYLSGANGGGKTTYLRSIGIAAVLARSGLPVPAKMMSTCVFGNVLTHFPRNEHGESRLEDERRRAAEIAATHGGCSLVLLNETFSTTTIEKASALTAEFAASLAESGCITLYITHQLPENSALPVLTVAVDGADSERTYKVVRSSGKTSSYAADILRKYGF
ncbi:MAG: hypothetical protein LBD85_04560 [Oscillospiraceae bacterium]|jgi:hypothetical protein|nr:hypothetical protein [Oscillospiraceae bacterium]